MRKALLAVLLCLAPSLAPAQSAYEGEPERLRAAVRRANQQNQRDYRRDQLRQQRNDAAALREMERDIRNRNEELARSHDAYQEEMERQEARQRREAERERDQALREQALRDQAFRDPSQGYESRRRDSEPHWADPAPIAAPDENWSLGRSRREREAAENCHPGGWVKGGYDAKGGYVPRHWEESNCP